MKSRFTRFAMLFALGALSLALLAACSSDEDADTDDAEATAAATEAAGDDADDDAETTITVGMTEFAFELSAASAPAGEVTFEVTNNGALPHEFKVVRSDEAPDSLPLDGAVVDESDLDIVDSIDEFAAGTTESGTFELEAGNYILLCNIAGHYQGGMFTAFVVE